MTATFESFKHRSPLATAFPAGGNGPRLPRSFTWSLRLIACAALGVTGYLAIIALRAGEVAGCSGGDVWDCGLALHSRWAKVLNTPVSVPAFVLYALVLTSLAFCRSTATNSRLRAAWSVVTVSAIAAGLAAIWFIGLQVFALGSPVRLLPGRSLVRACPLCARVVEATAGRPCDGAIGRD